MTTSKTTIRCLVIQLARLGDSLQSLMALRAAQQLYPNLEIHFLTRERFSEAAKRVPWIQSVITLPTQTILGPLIQGDQDENQTLAALGAWVSPLTQEPWDIVVNWSYSEASSFLASLIPTKFKLGYTRRRDARFSLLGSDGWSHYIQGVIQSGIEQNIHLIDIFTTQLLTALQLHFGEPQAVGNAPVTSKGFFSLRLKESDMQEYLSDFGRKWITVQLGAGKDNKRWHPIKWARLTKAILEANPDCGIFLVGGKDDTERYQLFLKEMGTFLEGRTSFVPLIGETDFDLWASIISRSQWLIASDTAAIHLAGVLGTRVLNLSLGEARFLETGPYGNSHYVITEEGAASEGPSVEAVFATWTYANSDKSVANLPSLDRHFEDRGWKSHLNSIRIYKSRIRTANEGGGVVYESAIKKPLQITHWTSMVLGHIARSWYCGWVPPMGQEVTRDAIDSNLIQKLRELQNSSSVLAKICEQARRTALQLNKRSANLKSDKVMAIQDKEELNALGNTLHELEVLLERLAKSHPPLLAFAQMSKVLMHHLNGTYLAELGEEAAQCYKQLNEGALLLKDWVRFTLDLAKPVSVPTAVSSNIPAALQSSVNSSGELL